MDVPRRKILPDSTAGRILCVRMTIKPRQSLALPIRRSAARKPARIVFVTGTDTGVGKTLLTALLLVHLRARGASVVALKPFCSGSRADADLLWKLQDGALAMDEINPFFFTEPVAPLVSQQLHRRFVTLKGALRHIQTIARRYEWVVIEGSGGLLVPLGEGFTVRDLITRLNCEVVVVGRNQLGTINHTLLTMESLASARIRKRTVVLMNGPRRDVSAATNARILSGFLPAKRLFALPYLGSRTNLSGACRANAIFLKKTLADILR